MSRKSLLFILVPIILTGLLIAGCDQRITSSKTAGYSILGALVKNADDNILAAQAIYKRNDSVFVTGKIKIGSDSLHYSSGQFSRIYDSLGVLPAGSYRLKLQDSSLFSDSVSFPLPANLAITSIVPDTRIYTSGTSNVRLEFQSSAGSNGYVFGVVKADSAYQIAGYSDFITTGSTAVTIPPDAFRLSGNLDTGWYYIYVYAYSGSPAPLGYLPTAFPAGLSANVIHLKLSGNWGAVVVSKRDSMHVVTL
jgi:hypothetical protein